MTLKLTVVSDAICPWCWIGKKRLDDALAMLAGSDPELRFELAFFPFMLNPDMPDEGVERRTAHLSPASLRKPAPWRGRHALRRSTGGSFRCRVTLSTAPCAAISQLLAGAP